MKLTKEQYDALPEGLKAQFKAVGDEFEQIPQGEDVQGLKDQNAKLLAEKREAKKLQDEAAAEAKRLVDENARKSGDVAALEKSWQEKLNAKEAELTGKLSSYQKTVNELTIGSAAKEIGAKVFGKNAGLMTPHILQRLALEEVDGAFKVRVTKDGKPSALTMDDLAKEFQVNPEYASVVVASQSSGGPKNPTVPVTPVVNANDASAAMRASAVEIASRIGNE